ncbi:MAG: hypothetical protein WCG08_13615, partial [Paludibacter sp.]
PGLVRQPRFVQSLQQEHFDVVQTLVGCRWHVGRLGGRGVGAAAVQGADCGRAERPQLERFLLYCMF